VEYFFDYVSPYAYLANTQLSDLGVAAEIRPVVILEVMKRVKNQPSPLCPPKGRYAVLDAARWAELYGVPLAANQRLWAALRAGEFDASILVRGALTAKEEGRLATYHDAMFRAVWGAPADVQTAAGREAFAKAQGLSADFWDRAADPALDARVEADIAEAVERGVFGVPTFFVDGEIFFGNDRLDWVRRRLAERQGVAA
jgi:2-hydroxychromene-2-carboxylate isomerase